MTLYRNIKRSTFIEFKQGPYNQIDDKLSDNVFSPDITDDDINSVLNTLIKKDISGTSEVVNQFENKFKNLIGMNYCTSVSMGSVALDLALQSLNLKKGDEVILPSLTIISCLSSILSRGNTSFLRDVDIDSWNMTLEDVKKS